MNEHGKINYVELPAKDLEATKLFFTKAFGWSFVDYAQSTQLFLVLALMVVSLNQINLH